MVTVVVTTLLAVVSAEQPLQVVQGASVPQGPLVQPLQVLGGQALPPHQEVQGPWVQEPVEASLQGPQPLPGPPGPKGPTPLPPCQPPGPPPLESLALGPQAPPKGPGAPVVWVCQEETAEAQAEFVVQAEGHAEPPEGKIVSLVFSLERG